MIDTTNDGIRGGTARLIEESHAHDAFYEGNLSNHLPMALVALDRLGAAPERIEAFAARYRKKLQPLAAPLDVLTEENAERFLGRPETLPSWVVFFKEAVARDGAERTTRRWTGRLMPGVGSVAFHGLIRLAYALDGGVEAELVHALAHWAAGYAALGDLPAPSAAPTSPAAALASLKGDPRFAKDRFPGRRIADRMARAAADPETSALVAAAGTPELDALASALLGAYAATGDFTVLHGLTASHAFAGLTPYMEDPALARRYLWQALVCAYLSAGGPAAGAPLAGDETWTWEEIRRRAAAATDEHDVKLAYSCWRLWQRYGDDRYRRAASATLA